ncbi:glycosyltransferase family 2 protein [Ruminococcaceae bacterium OttesenSCG-928-I18]|nr:glycosyltransferase family 2 protein [Ruminococcaceae bacterium OttesenSCG-928-I18]
MGGKVAVLIPCYNEAITIQKVVEDFKEALPEADIYVYDNNSTDGTAEVAKAAGAIVRKEPQQGKGNVMRSMFRHIEADCYLMVDGDDTYPAVHAKEMVDMVLNQNMDLVIGDRLSSTYFTENKRPFHNMGNVLVRWLINRLFKSDIKDIMTGYRCMSYAFVKNYPITSKGFEIETEMTIHALDKKYHIAAIPVQYQDRPEGSVSKLNTYTDGLRVLKTIFLMVREYRPLLFFSLLSLLFLLIALVMFLPILVRYAQTGFVDRIPTLVVSGFALIVAVQSFFSGLILDVVAQKYRQVYQIGLNKTLAPRDRHKDGQDPS